MVLTYTNKYWKSTGAGARGERSEREFQFDGVAGSPGSHLQSVS